MLVAFFGSINGAAGFPAIWLFAGGVFYDPIGLAKYIGEHFRCQAPRVSV